MLCSSSPTITSKLPLNYRTFTLENHLLTVTKDIKKNLSQDWQEECGCETVCFPIHNVEVKNQEGYLSCGAPNMSHHHHLPDMPAWNKSAEKSSFHNIWLKISSDTLHLGKMEGCWKPRDPLKGPKSRLTHLQTLALSSSKGKQLEKCQEHIERNWIDFRVSAGGAALWERSAGRCHCSFVEPALHKAGKNRQKCRQVPLILYWALSPCSLKA